MIDNVVVPVASFYSLAKEYEYLKYSINEYLTGSFSITSTCLFNTRHCRIRYVEFSWDL